MEAIGAWITKNGPLPLNDAEQYDRALEEITEAVAKLDREIP